MCIFTNKIVINELYIVMQNMEESRNYCQLPISLLRYRVMDKKPSARINFHFLALLLQLGFYQ